MGLNMEREIPPLKFSNEQTLSGLRNRASQIHRALVRLGVIQKQLGDTDKPSFPRTDNRNSLPVSKGFQRLNRLHLVSLPRQDRDAGIVKIVETKEKIGEVIIPALEAHKSQVVQKIAEAKVLVDQSEEVKRLKALLVKFEERKPKGYATEEDIKIIQQDLKETEENTVIYFNQPQALTPPLETPPTEPTDESPEEEKQRREKLMDLIKNSTLSDLEKRVFEAGVIYSKEDLGTNTKWAQAVFGEEIPIEKGMVRLDTARRNGLKKLSDKIELMVVWPPERHRSTSAGYYLRLKEVQPTPKPEFGAEVLAEISELTADLNELRRNLADTASESTLHERVLAGIEEKERRLADLMAERGDQASSSETKPLKLLLLKKYDPYFESELTDLVRKTEALNGERWGYDKIYAQFKINFQYIRNILKKGLLGTFTFTGPVRQLTFDSATVAAIRYIYQHRNNIKRETDANLAAEIRTVTQEIAQELQTPA